AMGLFDKPSGDCELTRVGLPEPRRLSLFLEQLAVSTHGQHLDGLMLGRIAHDLAKLAAFANVRHDLGHHILRIEKDTVCFGTIHDAEATSILRHALLVRHHRYVVHASSFTPLTQPRPSTRRDSFPPIRPRVRAFFTTARFLASSNSFFANFFVIA